MDSPSETEILELLKKLQSLLEESNERFAQAALARELDGKLREELRIGAEKCQQGSEQIFPSLEQACKSALEDAQQSRAQLEVIIEESKEEAESKESLGFAARMRAFVNKQRSEA